jgi:hypothetical protein
MSDDGYIMCAIPITPQNKDALVETAMSMYVGETCPFCGKKFASLADLQGSIWAGNGPAHPACWQNREIAL